MIKRLIGHIDDTLYIPGMCRILSDAATCSHHLPSELMSKTDALLLQLLSDSVSDAFGYDDVHISDHHQELLSAISHRDIGFPDALFYYIRKEFQQLVPCCVSVRIIVTLEVVQIEHQYVYHRIPVVCICHFFLYLLIEIVSVGKAGQLICTGKSEFFLPEFIVFFTSKLSLDMPKAARMNKISYIIILDQLSR